MSASPWLARLKNARTLELIPTKPTKPCIEEPVGGSVGFEGSGSGEVKKTRFTESGGSVGFAGSEAGARPHSEGPERTALPVVVPEHYAHAARVHRLIERGMGVQVAQALADRLNLRDQDGDDRRLCLECSYLAARGRCIAAATGRLYGVSAQLEPMQTLLQRCDGFKLRKGLT